MDAISHCIFMTVWDRRTMTGIIPLHNINEINCQNCSEIFPRILMFLKMFQPDPTHISTLQVSKFCRKMKCFKKSRELCKWEMTSETAWGSKVTFRAGSRLHCYCLKTRIFSFSETHIKMFLYYKAPLFHIHISECEAWSTQKLKSSWPALVSSLQHLFTISRWLLINWHY